METQGEIQGGHPDLPNPAVADPAVPEPKKPGAIGAIWRGDHPLWFTVWVLGLGGGLVMMLFWSSLGRAVATQNSPLQKMAAWMGPHVWLLIAGPLFLACCLYLIIVMVGIWHSADRYQGWRIWRWSAYAVVILGALRLLDLVARVLTS